MNRIFLSKDWVPCEEKDAVAVKVFSENSLAPQTLIYNGGKPRQMTRSLPESRALTISIDFDRTFAADPSLWGEFAEDAVENGNTVVMVSRREDTPENQQIVRDTLGTYAGYFSQVLLVGADTLKEAGAAAAGIDVDVWVDDSPQTITDKPAPEPKKRSRKKKGSDGGTV